MEQNSPGPDNDAASALRQALVGELQRLGRINTAPVEAAFRAIPRHLFIPDVSLEEAYADRAIATKKDEEQGAWLSSASQPAMVAIMLEQLDLEPGHNVLEIGAGVGYNAALMAHIVGPTGQVTTIDIDPELAEKAGQNLAALNFNQAQVICADGGYGHLEAAPYDKVILTVRPPDIVPAWLEQLKPGGRLVLPLQIKRDQLSIAFEKVDGHLASRSIYPCGFMVLRGAFAEEAADAVQLGPEPGLSLDLIDARPTDAEQIYHWLAGSSHDWESNIEITMRDVFVGLGLWLMLPETQIAILDAQGEMIERNLVPPLISFDGERKSVSTLVLLGNKGMAALMRSPEQTLSPMDICEPFKSDTPFKLFVRQFGPDESPARRLLRLAQSWAKAGRPSTEGKGFGIRAYPKDAPYSASKDEFVVEKKWMRYVLGWPAVPFVE
jgi:protein-L-isoaspartate(D-aspartate) O-methyltransferase